MLTTDYGGIVIIVGTITWLGAAGLSAYVAAEKGYEAMLWLVLGILLGPIVLLGSCGLPNKAQNQVATQEHAQHSSHTDDQEVRALVKKLQGGSSQ